MCFEWGFKIEWVPSLTGSFANESSSSCKYKKDTGQTKETCPVLWRVKFATCFFFSLPIECKVYKFNCTLLAVATCRLILLLLLLLVLLLRWILLVCVYRLACLCNVPFEKRWQGERKRKRDKLPCEHEFWLSQSLIVHEVLSLSLREEKERAKVTKNTARGVSRKHKHTPIGAVVRHMALEKRGREEGEGRRTEEKWREDLIFTGKTCTRVQVRSKNSAEWIEKNVRGERRRFARHKRMKERERERESLQFESLLRFCFSSLSLFPLFWAEERKRETRDTSSNTHKDTNSQKWARC